MRAEAVFSANKTGAAKVLAANFSIVLFAMILMISAGAALTFSADSVDVMNGGFSLGASIDVGPVQHDADVTLSPQWSRCGSTEEFTVTVAANQGPAAVNWVEIYDGTYGGVITDFPPHSNFVCGDAPAGWNLVYNHTIPLFPFCQYLATDPSYFLTPGMSQTFTFRSTMTTESNYSWAIVTRDNSTSGQGAWLPHYPRIVMDCSPPVTTKYFNGPQYPENAEQAEYPRWISSGTNIELSATDSEPHPIGFNSTYKRVTLVDDDYCREQKLCEQVDARTIEIAPPSFGIYDGQFNIPEQSCHMIEYYSDDKIGNTERTKVQCVFVDNTAPVLEKTVGEPKIQLCDGGNGEQTVLTFEDLQGQNSLPKNYGGINWTTDWNYYDWSQPPYTPHSGAIRIYNNNEEHPTFGFPSLTTFEGAWLSGQDYRSVRFMGYKDDVLVGMSAEIALSATPQWLAANFGGAVNKVVLNLSGVQGQPWNYFVMDDVTFRAGDCETQITSKTPITMTCTDQEPHPVDHNTITYRYKVNDGAFGAWTTYTGPFTFPEESRHTLEYNCSDALGNRGQTQTEIDVVDNTPPAIDMKIGEPQIGTCPAKDGKDCYIRDHVTPVTFNVTDTGAHLTGLDRCEWSYTVNGNEGDSGVEREYPFQIIFPEDSEHVLTVKCYDRLGNVNTLVQKFLVDSIPPETTKEYGTPFVSAGNLEGTEDGNTYHWINTDTQVKLTAVDQQPHPVGMGTIYWRTTLLDIDDESCLAACEQYSGEGAWSNATGDKAAFTIPEESCHLIEFYSVDKLGNNESQVWDGRWYGREPNKQCVFVDNTPPVTTKEIGEPKVVKTEGQVCDGQSQAVIGASIAPGTNLRQIHGGYSQPCSINTGIAFDGSNLMMTCWYHNKIDFLSPADGSLVGSVTVPGYSGLMAAAWDGTRNKLWACAEQNKVILINTTDGSSTYMFTATDQCTDGLAYDGTDDTIWTSGDVHTNVYHYKSNGTLIEIKSVGGLLGGLGNSGIAVGGDKLYLANNGGSQIYALPKDFSSSTLFATFPERLEDMECDDITFANQGVGAIWSQDAYDRTINAYAIEKGKCGFGGLPPAPTCQNATNVTYITQQTPITLTCKDPQPHPVNNITLKYRYAVNNGEWTDWIIGTSGQSFTFPQDSNHTLEYYCKDSLGNTEETQSEIDIVDTVPPVITKTIIGPRYGDCPPKNHANDLSIQTDGSLPPEGDRCYVDGATTIQVDAVDPQPHPVDGVKCDWSVSIRQICEENDGNGGCGGGGYGKEGVTAPFNITFPEESVHDLKIVCRDALGNTARDYETFIVDHTPPVTKKYLKGPQYPEDAEEAEYPRWINSKTNITLKAYDPEPHPSGVNATYTEVTIVDDKYCRDQELCENYGAEIDALHKKKYLKTIFNIPEESCHMIEYYSVDNVEKKEQVKRQCLFVDNTPPTPVKTVGKPGDKIYAADYNWTYYPEVNGRCWNGQENSIDCWKVTTMTPITMSCNDTGNHPVDHSTLSFNVDFDNGDMTQAYCDKLGGTRGEDGYCKLQSEEPVELLFGEESEHNLKFYCTDALGNKGPVDDEKFKVEGSSFKIEINKKWNLISVPFVLLNDSMHKVFDPEADKIKSVWTYDGVTNQWYVYTPDGVDNDNMNSMMPGNGYWVLAGNDTTLLIGGSLFSPAKTPPSKTIVKGWNLIGYWGTEGMSGYYGPSNSGTSAFCEFSSLGKDVWDIRFASLWSYWEPWNGDPSKKPTYAWIPYNKYNITNPGAGYWLFTNQEGEYVVPTECSATPITY